MRCLPTLLCIMTLQSSCLRSGFQSYDPCQHTLCPNHAICKTDNKNSVLCICQPGWEATTAGQCQQISDTCNSDEDCTNSDTCRLARCLDAHCVLQNAPDDSPCDDDLACTDHDKCILPQIPNCATPWALWPTLRAEFFMLSMEVLVLQTISACPSPMMKTRRT